MCSICIMMPYFHFSHKFLVHINFTIHGFPMTPLIGDLAAIFFSQLQYRPSVKHRCFMEEIAVSNCSSPHKILGIVAFPTGLCMSTHCFSLSTLSLPCKEMLYMMYVGKVNKRKTGFLLLCFRFSDVFP